MSVEATIAVTVLAFAFGFVVQRGSVCGVLAARQIVETGHTLRLLAFITASLWALVVAVPLTWIAPDRFALAPSYTGVGIATFGGAINGLGTIVNGACVFGTASRALSGNLSFIVALPGIAGGAVLVSAMQIARLQSVSSPSPLLRPTSTGVILLAVVSVFAAGALLGIVRRHSRSGLRMAHLLRASRWRTSISMLLIGIIGGVLFAGGGAWTYPSMMRQLGNAAAGLPWSLPLVTLLGPLALIAGGLVSVRLGGRFAMRRLELRQIARSGAGGAIMGLASTFVPGGNDVMLLAVCRASDCTWHRPIRQCWGRRWGFSGVGADGGRACGVLSPRYLKIAVSRIRLEHLGAFPEKAMWNGMPSVMV